MLSLALVLHVKCCEYYELSESCVENLIKGSKDIMHGKKSGLLLSGAEQKSFARLSPIS